MTKNKVFTVLTSLAFAVLCSNMTLANKRDSVITMKIDPNSLPKNANIIRQRDELKLTGEDSARLVVKKVTDMTERPRSHANLHVNKSVYGQHTDFIVDYVKNYHTNHGSRLDRIYSNNRGYFKLIDNVMKKYNLPRELRSLAIIESAMNCNAVSPVGAVGPWQFMQGTARMLGLRCDGTLDERRDFYKSTHAAAKYLKYLHDMFGDWLLVIASYNCGPAPVLRAINSGMGRSFWDIKPKLPKETQNHVMAFIATTSYLDRSANPLAMGEIPKGAKAPKADFSNLSSGFAMADDVVDDASKPQISKEEMDQVAILRVKGNYKLAAISSILEEDHAKLKRWNPTFDESIANAAAPVKLLIPITKIEQFIISKEKIIQESRKG